MSSIFLVRAQLHWILSERYSSPSVNNLDSLFPASFDGRRQQRHRPSNSSKGLIRAQTRGTHSITPYPVSRLSRREILLEKSKEEPEKRADVVWKCAGVIVSVLITSRVSAYRALSANDPLEAGRHPFPPPPLPCRPLFLFRFSFPPSFSLFSLLRSVPDSCAKVIIA